MDWQIVVVTLAVAAALIYLTGGARKVLLGAFGRGTSGAPGCGGCPSNATRAAGPAPLVRITRPARSGRR